MEFFVQEHCIFAKNAAGETVAEIEFPQTSDDTCTITRTFVDESLRGQGVAGELVRRAVETIVAAGFRVEARCSYAAAWLEKHKRP